MKRLLANPIILNALIWALAILVSSTLVAADQGESVFIVLSGLWFASNEVLRRSRPEAEACRR